MKHEAQKSETIVMRTIIVCLLLSGVVGLAEGLPDKIELLPGGAVARFGPHQVTFAADVRTRAGIVVRLPDGRELRSHILGLCYYNEAGQGVPLAAVKECIGEVTSDNQVVYRDAFDTVAADVVYKYTRSTFEQDVVLRDQLPSPAGFGFAPERTRLAVVTEFVDPPEPRKAETTLSLRERFPAAPAGAVDHLMDEALDFGSIRITAGKAFAIGATDRVIPVAKNWQGWEGRHFLIESTPYWLVAEHLDDLPAGQLAGGHTARPQALRLAVVQLDRPAGSAAGKPMTLASANAAPRPGFVLDYLMEIVQGAAGGETDTDADGLPDSWELQCFGNLNQTAGDDYDGDGVTNLQEYQGGTNPANADSNGDGVMDQARQIRVTKPARASVLP